MPLRVSKSPQSPLPIPRSTTFQSPPGAPVILYSVVRVSEVLGSLPAHIELFYEIRGQTKVSLTYFLGNVGAKMSTTLSAPTPAPPTGVSYL